MRYLIIIFILIIFGCSSNENLEERNSENSSIIDHLESKSTDHLIMNIVDIDEILEQDEKNLNLDSTRNLVHQYGLFLLEHDSILFASCIVNFHFKLNGEIYNLDSISIDRKENAGLFVLEFDHLIVEKHNTDSLYSERIDFGIAASYFTKDILVELEESIEENSKRTVKRTQHQSLRLAYSFETELLNPKRKISFDNSELKPNCLYQNQIKTRQSRLNMNCKAILTGICKENELIMIRENNLVLSNP